MKQQKDRVRVNRAIVAKQVRVIGEDGNQVGIMTTSEALDMAKRASLDLVEISPNVEPPVCRIMDYGKFLFLKNKERNLAKKKQKQMQVKEIKFRPATDEGDFKVKLKKIINFLENGDKVKITLRFRGREMAHQQLGMEMLDRVEREIGELGTVEHRPKLEGRQLVMVIVPTKK